MQELPSNWLRDILKRKKISLILIALLSIPSSTIAQGKLKFSEYGTFGSVVYYFIQDAAKNPETAFKLHLTGEISEKDLKRAPVLNYLQALMLENNALDSFPIEFCKFPSLMYLSIRNNPIKEIPADITNNSSLTEFEISGAEIDSLSIASLELSALKYLTIHNNLSPNLVLTDTAGAYLPPALEELIIYNSNLQELSPNICNLPALKKLNLTGNKLKALPKEIGWMKEVEWLILDDNKLSQIPGSIGQLRKVAHLSLRNNYLESLPDNIANMTNLGFLDLRGNPIGEYQIDILRILLPGCRILYDPLFKKESD